jgi:hypothetical protein
MTALERLARAQRALTVATLVDGALWGLAVAILLMVRLPVPVSLMSGLAVFAFLLWRNRKVRSSKDVALWLEWQVPALRYALVTLAEGKSVGVGPVLEETVAGTTWGGPIRHALLRKMSLPAVLLLFSIGAFFLLPPIARDRAASTDNARGSESNRGPSISDPFRLVVVTVTPPPYSRRSRMRLEQPEAVTSLVGSSLQIEGNGWSVATTMPDSATPFWLDRDGHRRLLLLLPIPDSAPTVQLLVPARDSVLRVSEGVLALSGNAHDDFGLGAAWFEYIVSSGEGENYTFRSGIIGRRSLASVARTDLASRISLDSLRLAPGNIVHLRAVAQDENNVSGPGVGYSETRTIRIPRPGEGDSVSVGRVAPAAGDSSLLSQRMLVIMTETLERRRPGLRRDTFLIESRRIAGEQATLRRRVADIIFLRLGAEGSMEESEDSTAEPLTPEALLEAAEQATVTSGGEALDFAADETPVVALNRPLLEAYNAMWAGGRELEIGEPRRALPHMRDALEAIQRARQAERIYLRGRPTPSVIDLAKVRLVGTLADAAPSGTLPSARDRRSREALLGRYTRAVERLPAREIVDSLQLLRIDALETEPRFAAALGEAVTALRTGQDATGALIRARRLLAGPLQAASGLEAWDLAP